MIEIRHQTLTVFVVTALYLLLVSLPGPAPAQDSAPDPATDQAGDLDEIGGDTDPTKPVAFSFRNEFYDLKGDAWQNVVILRADQLILDKKEILGHRRGVILRADIPMVSSHFGGSTLTGLGDFYGQALLIPRVTGDFMCAVGTGLTIPTATGDEFGHGKWVIAPSAIPIWFFPHRGYAYVKFQDWISFAGDSGRPDIHYLTVTPTFLWRVAQRWWMMLDGESYTDWETNNQTSYKGGILIGRMFSKKTGLSLKAEIPFGEHRQGEWTVKAVFFITRY